VEDLDDGFGLRRFAKLGETHQVAAQRGDLAAVALEQ
jgi:hypothetical protein